MVAPGTLIDGKGSIDNNRCSFGGDTKSNIWMIVFGQLAVNAVVAVLTLAATVLSLGHRGRSRAQFGKERRLNHVTSVKAKDRSAELSRTKCFRRPRITTQSWRQRPTPPPAPNAMACPPRRRRLCDMCCEGVRSSSSLASRLSGRARPPSAQLGAFLLDDLALGCSCRPPKHSAECAGGVASHGSA